MFIAGVSFYMLHNSMQTEATELAPSARGSAVALFACGFFVGQGLGPIVFAALLHGLGPRAARFRFSQCPLGCGRQSAAGHVVWLGRWIEGRRLVAVRVHVGWAWVTAHRHLWLSKARHKPAAELAYKLGAGGRT